MPDQGSWPASNTRGIELGNLDETSSEGTVLDDCVKGDGLAHGLRVLSPQLFEGEGKDESITYHHITILGVHIQPRVKKIRSHYNEDIGSREGSSCECRSTRQHQKPTTVPHTSNSEGSKNAACASSNHESVHRPQGARLSESTLHVKQSIFLSVLRYIYITCAEGCMLQRGVGLSLALSRWLYSEFP